MPLQNIYRIRLGQHVCQLVVGMNVEDGDEARCDGRSKVVVLHIYVLGTRAHGWSLRKAQGTCVVFEKLAVDHWNSLPNSVPPFFHLLDCLHERNGLAQGLAEAYVL
jgi:hypothetical protein